MGTVPAKNRGFGKYILKSPFRFSGKVRKSWSCPPPNVDFQKLISKKLILKSCFSKVHFEQLTFEKINLTFSNLIFTF